MKKAVTNFRKIKKLSKVNYKKLANKLIKYIAKKHYNKFKVHNVKSKAIKPFKSSVEKSTIKEKHVKLQSIAQPKKLAKQINTATKPSPNLKPKSVKHHLKESNLPKLPPIKEKRKILRLKDANKLKEKYDARLLRNLTSIQEFQEKHESLAFLIKALFQDTDDIPQMKLHESAAAMVFNFHWYKNLYERNKITKAQLKELTDTNIENLQALFKQVQQLRGGNKYKAALSNMIISNISENIVYENNEQYYIRTDLTGSSHLGSKNNFSAKDLRTNPEFINHLSQIYNSKYAESLRELMSFNTFRLRVAKALITKFVL